MRDIDHLVMVVNDLEAARVVYSQLGLTTTPRALHPFGTENFLVQLQGNFLEVVGVADASIIPPHGDGIFSFARANADFLARRVGMSSLVFQSADARADRSDFLAAGLQAYENVDFSRKAVLPDGAEVTVAFSLAFVTDPTMPEVTFFTCQQHAPEHFWKPEYQVHANGAQQVAEVIMVAPDPSSHADFFRGIHGDGALALSDDGLSVETGVGSISMVTPDIFETRFGIPTPGPTTTAHFAGFRIVVKNLRDTHTYLATASVETRVMTDAVQVGPYGHFGIVIEFTENV